jgi:hypothetical protein
MKGAVGLPVHPFLHSLSLIYTLDYYRGKLFLLNLDIYNDETMLTRQQKIYECAPVIYCNNQFPVSTGEESRDMFADIL